MHQRSFCVWPNLSISPTVLEQTLGLMKVVFKKGPAISVKACPLVLCCVCSLTLGWHSMIGDLALDLSNMLTFCWVPEQDGLGFRLWIFCNNFNLSLTFCRVPEQDGLGFRLWIYHLETWLPLQAEKSRLYQVICIMMTFYQVHDINIVRIKSKVLLLNIDLKGLWASSLVVESPP